MQPSISLCMIIKNEADSLPGCLESVKDLVEEMVILDTGSTDRSVEIAEDYGARVFHHTWNNDFSEARNQALQHATGDWILHLDADEVLRRKDIPLLKETIRDQYTNGVQCIIYNVQKDSTDFLLSYFFRLFRNKIGVHYTGIIHESPIIPGKLLYSDIGIIHYGYALHKEGWKDKCDRNIILLKKQLSDNPDDPFLHFHLAKTYYQEQSFEKALTEGREVLRLMPKDAFKTRPELEIFVLISCVLYNAGYLPEAEKTCLEAIEINPNYLDPYFFLGHIYLKQEEFDKAILQYRKYQDTLKSLEEGLHPHSVGLHTFTKKHEVFFALGTIYERQKDYENAAKEYLNAIEANPGYAEPYNGLGTVYFAQDMIDDAIAMLEKAIEINPDFAMAHKNIGVAYAKQNKFEQAAEAFERAIQTVSKDQKT